MAESRAKPSAVAGTQHYYILGYMNNCFFMNFYYCTFTSAPTSATCTSESCLNGGTCLTGASGESRCSCLENYIGADCSESISCTSDVQCGSKTCKVYQGQNYCDCGDVLTGFFCGVAVSQGVLSLFMFTIRVRRGGLKG
jgi:hypothetical protein